MGYLAGFVARETKPVRHFVVNAAFNPENSGGPLLLTGEDTVIGVVVSKHAPKPQQFIIVQKVTPMLKQPKPKDLENG